VDDNERPTFEEAKDFPMEAMYAKIPWGGDHTILGAVLIVSDRNAYHLGEFAIMRQVMDTWGNRG
jgi:hypothetical protein